jgi:papain like protease
MTGSHTQEPASVLSAASLPVSRLGLKKQVVSRLKRKAIVTALQLAELVEMHPRRIKSLTGMGAAALRKHLTEEMGTLPDFSSAAMRSQVPFAPAGVQGPPPASEAVRAMVPDSRLKNFLATLVDLPSKSFLNRKMPPVSSQEQTPNCVGHATSGTVCYDSSIVGSNDYAYMGAKAWDGHPHIEGSWLIFALKHAYLVGHVKYPDYTFEDGLKRLPIDLLANKASSHRINGFSGLLPKTGGLGHLPKLFRAILSGRLNDTIGPRPIPASIMLFESFVSYSASRDGMIPLPFQGEKKLGGHAMVLVGYIDADDPENQFGVSYFLVRNSWSASWAAKNPFDAPGHALIPEAYFTRDNQVFEAYISLGLGGSVTSNGDGLVK